MQSNLINHSGILGMKWGIRKDRDKAGHKLPPKPARKLISDMSDDELKKIVNRLQLESQFRQYIAQMNPKKESKIKALAADMLMDGAKVIVKQGFTKLAKQIFAVEEPKKKAT